MHSGLLPRRGFVAGLFAAAAVSGGCQRAESDPKPSAEQRELSVFAASSLRDAFTELGREFERAHAGVRVVFNVAGTQELRTQLEHGARADVFASADLKHANELVESKRILAPVSFARNEPVVVVPIDAEPGLRAFGDLPSVAKLVIGTPEVPIGRYTLQILDRANQQLGADFRSRVEAKVVSRELNVRQVLAKISLGEADAAIVYRTDANAAREKVRIVPIPPDLNVIAEYPIAVVADAQQPELAVEWVNLLRSEAGRKVLLAAGFLPPEAPAQPK
jgi:molybdate transport system substrate-binding protein